MPLQDAASAKSKNRHPCLHGDEDSLAFRDFLNGMQGHRARFTFSDRSLQKCTEEGMLAHCNSARAAGRQQLAQTVCPHFIDGP
jgi:hypothetical protein